MDCHNLTVRGGGGGKRKNEIFPPLGAISADRTQPITGPDSSIIGIYELSIVFPTLGSTFKNLWLSYKMVYIRIVFLLNLIKIWIV